MSRLFASPDRKTLANFNIQHYISRPPSQMMQAPVVKEDASDAADRGRVDNGTAAGFFHQRGGFPGDRTAG